MLLYIWSKTADLDGAPKGTSWGGVFFIFFYIHFILNLDSSIKKHSQCLVQGTLLGHYKMLNVAYCIKTYSIIINTDNIMRLIILDEPSVSCVFAPADKTL